MSDENKNRFEDFEKESLYAIMAETEKLANVGGWEWDIVKDVWTFSDNWLRIHGCSGRHLKTADLIPIAHPDDRADVEKAFDKAVAEGADYEIEHRIIRQDTGEERYIRSLGKPLRDHDGKVVKLFGSAQDITRQKKAEEELRQTRTLLESSIESPEDMIILSLDREYRYLYYNKAHMENMRHVYGANPRIGDCIFDHMKVVEDIEKVKAHYDRALAGERRVDIDQYGEGQLQYTFEVRYNPIYNEKNEVMGVSAFAQDITERTKTEKALLKSETLLKEAQRVAKLGHWELDAPSQTPVWSDEIFHIFGLDPRESEPSFEAHKKIIHEEDWDLLQTSIEELSANGTPYDLEFRILRTEGEIGWMHSIGLAEKNDDGHVERMYGIAQDITVRKQSEQALLKSNEMFKRTESIAHVGSWEWDILPDLVQWSDELFRIFGRDPSVGAVSWEDHRKLYVNEDMQRLKDAVEICVNKGKPFEIELRAIRTNGEIRHCISRGQAQTDESGKVIRLVGSFQDITEFKKTEQSLKASEEKYRLITENMTDVVSILDMNLRFTYTSPSMKRLTGFSTEAYINQSIEKIMSSQSFEKVTKIFEEEMMMEASGNADPYRTRIIEFEQYTQDRSTIWVEVANSFLRDSEKHPIGILAVTRDISERKQAAQALKESEAKYRSMIESMTDPVYICSPEFTVEHMNPAMIKRTGRDATGEPCHKALHNLDTRCDWCIFEKIKAGESQEINIVSPKDNRNYRITNMPINNPDGSVSKMTIMRDITDYTTAVAEKEKAQAQLIQTQKLESIGTLAGGIAHDFNNILSSIIGFAELALDDAEKGSSIEDSLHEIYSGGKRARDLVKQILVFSRQSDEEIKPMQIDTIAKEVLKLLRASIPITIQINQDIKKDLTVMGNSTQVHQVFMNICTNAAQAMEDGGILEVSIKDIVIDKNDGLKDLIPGEYVEIKVSDTGVGIDPAIMDKIFDPFFTTKEVGKGTGMGLALVHGIIKSYNGTITVESTPNQGSVFAVYLPLIRGLSVSNSYQPEILPTGNERILLVDDETPIVKMSSQILQKLGYEVVFRTSSIKALEVFRSEPDDFDLVITDMTMPDMTGEKLAAELMSVRRDIPVILCTGYSSKISDKTAAAIGIKAFAYKPVSKADLAKTVRKVLDEAKR